jgi:hypothetical protein
MGPYAFAERPIVVARLSSVPSLLQRSDASPSVENGGSARHRSWRLGSHPDQHRPEYLVLLAVDQQLGEDAGLGEYPVGIGIADGLT